MLTASIIFSALSLAKLVYAANPPGVVGTGQYSSLSYGGAGASQYKGPQAAASPYEDAQPDYGYQAPKPKYPPAMTHERNRNQAGYQSSASAKRFQENKEGLFDDFPGPKTQAKVYYPGRGYVMMAVPVQQPYKYGKGDYKETSSYDEPEQNYAPSPSPSYRPSAPLYPSHSQYASQPNYPAPSKPNYPPAKEVDDDSDSPFAYMVKRPSGPTYAASIATAQPYKPQPPPSRPPPSYPQGSGPQRPQYGGPQAMSHGQSGPAGPYGREPTGPAKPFISYNDVQAKPYVASQNERAGESGGMYNPPTGNPHGDYSKFGSPPSYKPNQPYPSSYPGSGDQSRDPASANASEESSLMLDSRVQGGHSGFYDAAEHDAK